MYFSNCLAFHDSRSRRLSGLIILLCCAAPATSSVAQQVNFRVDSPTQRLEMVVNSSRVLACDKDIPRLTVNNRDIVKVVPLSPNQIQVSASQAGVTQLNLWDADGEVRTVDIVVYPDARRLQLVLQAEFPQAAVRVRPLDNSVVLAGFVDRPEMVGKIVNIAEDFYPKVINNIEVGGVQQVALNVKVMEVSRTKLRAVGSDWAYLSNGDFLIDSAAGLISAAASTSTQIVGTGLDTVRFGIVNGDDTLFGFIEALRQNNLIKVLAEPTLVTVSGRPASFQEGGEFPIIVPQSLGVNSVDFKQFGTRVDFVPIVLGNGSIRLEVRPQVSEIDNSRGVDVNGVIVPGLRTRWVDTAVEMYAGQTLALAGLIQTRIEAETRGLPWLSELPWTGNLFGRTRETVNEIELLVLVRPELVAAMDPCELRHPLPGESTSSPNDIDFFARHYLEVPTCCPKPNCDPDCGPQGPGCGPGSQSFGPAYSPAPVIDATPMERNTAPTEIIKPYQGGSGDTDSRNNLPYSIESNQPGGEPELIGPSGHDELGPVAPTPINNVPYSIESNLGGGAPQQPQPSVPQAELIGPSGYDDLGP